MSLLLAALAPLLTPALAAPAAQDATDRPKVRVFVLAGQSNMEGKAKVSLLEHQATQPETAERFAHLRDGDEWAVRDDVWIKFLDRRGALTVGYGSPDRIGPELDFGHVVGDHFDEPVLLVKTAWGGKSLFRDFRPPSAGLPAEDALDRVFQKELSRNPDVAVDEVLASFGRYYRLMVDDVKAAVADPGALFPALAGHEAELAGFVWFQGWNDMIDDEATNEYAQNMAHLIRDLRRDLRRDLGAPELPVVIGQLGVGGTTRADAKRGKFKGAQAAVAMMSEFEDSVVLVRTDQYWDEEAQAVFDKGWKDHLEEWETVGSDYPYHYLGSARCYSDIGRAFGEAMLELREKRASD